MDHGDPVKRMLVPDPLCIECDGRGEIGWQDSEGEWHIESCDLCHGTGFASSEAR